MTPMGDNGNKEVGTLWCARKLRRCPGRTAGAGDISTNCWCITGASFALRIRARAEKGCVPSAARNPGHTRLSRPLAARSETQRTAKKKKLSKHFPAGTRLLTPGLVPHMPKETWTIASILTIALLLGLLGFSSYDKKQRLDQAQIQLAQAREAQAKSVVEAASLRDKLAGHPSRLHS